MDSGQVINSFFSAIHIEVFFIWRCWRSNFSDTIRNLMKVGIKKPESKLTIGGLSTLIWSRTCCSFFALHILGTRNVHNTLKFKFRIQQILKRWKLKSNSVINLKREIIPFCESVRKFQCILTQILTSK
jgi:hypothetical protein